MKMHDVLRSWLRASHGGCGTGGWGSQGGRQWAGGYGRGGHGHGGHHGEEGEPEGEGFGGGSFGVRRPLRFLAYKLELDEKQVAELARILDDLKTERAQGEVDRRRSLSGFADAVGGATFDTARVKEAAQLRVATAERLRDAVSGALGRLHALLDDAQRERLAYLIRTGVLSL
jgi:LTXXQ motif family protein